MGYRISRINHAVYFGDIVMYHDDNSSRQYGVIVGIQGFQRDCMTSGSLPNLILEGHSDGLKKMDIEELEKREAEILYPREIVKLLNCL